LENPIKNDVAPLLKWPGGKRLLLKYILPLVPLHYNRYYEPFVGGGALFFTLQPSRSILADSNEDLINCYQQVRDNPHVVISHLRKMKNSKEDYYAIRASHYRSKTKQAARLIYLMTLSFNGIHRVNERGEFNVPYGYNTEAIICDKAKILAISTALSSAKLIHRDFASVVSDAAPEDLIYFDPPYTVAHKNNGFVKYNAKIFSWDDQERLAKVAANLATQGCHVIISNADHPSVAELYRGFTMQRIVRSSLIAASADARYPITECVFYNME
jgi:DNA adenine methylase